MKECQENSSISYVGRRQAALTTPTLLAAARSDVDRLRDVVGKERGVPEIGGIFLVLAPRAPGGYNVGVPKQQADADGG